jgi:hypothetical protein
MERALTFRPTGLPPLCKPNVIPLQRNTCRHVAAVGYKGTMSRGRRSPCPAVW